MSHRRINSFHVSNSHEVWIVNGCEDYSGYKTLRRKNFQRMDSSFMKCPAKNVFVF